jgi:CBS domain-containing protein
MRAEEIMRGQDQDSGLRELVTVSEDTTVGDALQLLSEQPIRHLPVLRNGEVVGMLSDRDFRHLGLTTVTDIEHSDQVRARLTTPVSELMTGGVITVEPSTEVTEIIDIMVDEKVGALPVVDEHTNNLVGIISYVDVLRSLRDLAEED